MRTRTGFAPIVLILVIAAVAVTGGSYLVRWRQSAQQPTEQRTSAPESEHAIPPTPAASGSTAPPSPQAGPGSKIPNPLANLWHTPSPTPSKVEGPSPKNWPLLWGAPNPNCQKRPAALAASPIAIGDIAVVAPMGELAEGHIVPGEHIGINYDPDPATDGVRVFAPADGYIATVERHQYVPEGAFTAKLRNYHVYIVHSCTFFTGFVHVTNFSPELLAANAELRALDTGTVDERSKNIWPNIPVKAGQVIGTANAFGLLGMVTVDLATRIDGYVNPANYTDEGWRLNAAAPHGYFSEPIRSQFLSKTGRTAEPRGGTFDLDVDGRLVGSWFEPSSGGIKGSGAGLKRCGNFPCPAQDGQIAFVYDFMDPAQLRVSIGHNWGLAKGTPYGVKDNRPDFRNIGQTAGPVKYELVPLLNMNAAHNFSGEHAIFTKSDDATVLGTLLVEVTALRRIKVEVFPGRSASQVAGFTANVRMYER